MEDSRTLKPTKCYPFFLPPRLRWLGLVSEKSAKLRLPAREFDVKITLFRDSFPSILFPLSGEIKPVPVKYGSSREVVYEDFSAGPD